MLPARFIRPALADSTAIEDYLRFHFPTFAVDSLSTVSPCRVQTVADRFAQKVDDQPRVGGDDHRCAVDRYAHPLVQVEVKYRVHVQRHHDRLQPVVPDLHHKIDTCKGEGDAGNPARQAVGVRFAEQVHEHVTQFEQYPAEDNLYF